MNEEKRETLSFKELLKREKYILFDTSVREGPDWYARHVYDASSFSGIDASVLRLEAGCLEESLLPLSNPNVYTVPGTISEFENVRDIVQETLNFLNAKYEYNRRYHRHHRESYPRGETQRNLLNDIHTLFHDLYVQSKRSLFEPKKQDLYGILEKTVIAVTRAKGSKIDFGPRYGDFLKPKDFHTDEQLIATALYLSLTGQENCIITRDSDIRRILINTLQYLFHRRARCRVDGLEKAIQEDRIAIYYATSPEQGKIDLNTSSFKIERGISSATVSTINQDLRGQFPIIA